MVLVYLPLCDGEGRQVVSGLSERFLKISNKYGPAEIPAEWRKGGKGNRLQAYFSPASFVLALDEMLTEHGIDLWFDTKIIGAEKTDACRLSSIQVANKSGTGKIEAEVFVDATGDADAVHFAGGECLTARNALVSWFIEHREAGAYSQYSFGKDVSTIIVADGIRNNSTPEGIDGKTVSDFLLRGRRRYRELLEKDYEAGTETRKTRYPLVLPTMVPMRHSRCIKGRFVLDGGMEQARFPDSIGLGARLEKMRVCMGDSLPQSSAGKDYGRHRRRALFLRQRGCLGDHPRHTECGNDRRSGGSRRRAFPSARGSSS